MNLSAKEVLCIDLSRKSYEVKSFPELKMFFGGVGIGLKLLHSHLSDDPIILSIGPLTGFFPYASKTSIVMNSGGVVEDIYLGGALASRIKFTGLDAIMLSGKSAEPVVLDITDEQVTFRPATTEVTILGLPGKRSILSWSNMDIYSDEKKLLLDGYFTTPEKILEKEFMQKNIKALSVTGTKTLGIVNRENYESLYKELLSRTNEILVEKSSKPSCVGCPMGCEKSKTGEIGGNLIVHSLVACNLSENIYNNAGIVFSCLNVLGYDYTHEDIENLPKMLENILKDLA